MGFQMSQSYTSLFVKHDGVYVVALLLYVDDIILTGSNASKVQAIIQESEDVFELKDMGGCSFNIKIMVIFLSTNLNLLET